jgi:hypothetical protein
MSLSDITQAAEGLSRDRLMLRIAILAYGYAAQVSGE